MFTCPNCSTGLTRTAFEHGMCWGCPNCGGRAGGLALLRRTVAKSCLGSPWRGVSQRRGRASRPCPVCHRPMTEVEEGREEDTLPVDVCTRCEFVWLDRSEYERMPHAKQATQPTTTDHSLPPKARELLALYKVDQIAKEEEQHPNPTPDEMWKYVPAMLGLPVEIDEDPVSRVPWVTWSLAAVVTVVSLAALLAPKATVSNLAL